MIQIHLSGAQRDQINNIAAKDALHGTSKYSLHNTLLANEKELRKKHKEIYEYLFSCKSTLNEENIRSLVTANIDELEKYITNWGVKREDKLLKEIFRYKSFCRRDVAFGILQAIDAHSCPYCNRSFLFSEKNEKIKMVQFDHFFPKAKYPYLGLSVWNLIPSCPYCNQSKGDYDSSQEGEILYPYTEGFGYTNYFEIIEENGYHIDVIQGNSEHFEIEMHSVDEKADRNVNLFHIKEVYNGGHKKYARRVLKKQYIFTDTLIDEFLERHPGIFSSAQSVREAILDCVYEENRWIEDPLSKLTYDIIAHYSP